ITFDVTPVNDPPTGTDKTVTVNEDSSYSFAAADFGFGDVDGHTLTDVRIDTVATAGALTLNGTAVTAGQVVAAADFGNLAFAPAHDANGTAYASFTFSVKDSGGDFDLAPNTITINVTPVNDPPTGTDKTVTVNEDSSYSFAAADFGFGDVDGHTLTDVRIDTVAIAGALTLNGTAVTAGQVVAAADFGNLAFAPAHDANGTAYASFTFSVKDSGGDFDLAPNTITINVTPVNDPPTGTDKTVTVNEDSSYSFAAADFGFGDVDGHTLTDVRIDTVATAGALTLNGTAVTAGQVVVAADFGNLAFAPAHDANGTAYASFTFSVKDSGGDFDLAPNTITINVTPVNDSPTGTDKTVTVNEDSSYSFAAADFGFGDVDGHTLTDVRIDTVATAGALTLNGTAVTA